MRLPLPFVLLIVCIWSVHFKVTWVTYCYGLASSVFNANYFIGIILFKQEIFQNLLFWHLFSLYTKWYRPQSQKHHRLCTIVTLREYMILTVLHINGVKVNCRLLVLILRIFCSLSEKLKERVNIIKVCFRKLMISL